MYFFGSLQLTDPNRFTVQKEVNERCWGEKKTPTINLWCALLTVYKPFLGKRNWYTHQWKRKRETKESLAETLNDCRRCAILLNDYLKTVSMFVVCFFFFCVRLWNVYFMNYIKIYCISTCFSPFLFCILCTVNTYSHGKQRTI